MLCKSYKSPINYISVLQMLCLVIMPLSISLMSSIVTVSNQDYFVLVISTIILCIHQTRMAGGCIMFFTCRFVR